MRIEEVFSDWALVSRHVVGDHTDLFAARLVRDDVGVLRVPQSAICLIVLLIPTIILALQLLQAT